METAFEMRVLITDLLGLARDAKGEHWPALFDALSLPVYIARADGHLTYYNAAAARLAGRTPELGADRWDITWKSFHADGSPVNPEQSPMAEVLRGREHPPDRDYIAERPDGSRFWFRQHSAPLRDSEGRITGALNMLVDITDWKHQAFHAEYTDLLLRSIVNSSDDAIVSKNLEGVITSWNKGAERLFGYTAEEAIGQSILILFPPERVDEEASILERLRRGERIDHFETVRRRKDGTRVDISLTISPVRDAMGRTVGASKIARDITGAKRAERDLRLLAAIVDSSGDAIISKNLDGVITSWNLAAERLFGYTAEEAVGRSITMLIPEDRRDEEPRILARLKAGELIDHFHTVRRRKDGTLLNISLTVSPIRDSQGRVIGASKIARDITELKRIEAENLRANRDLEQFAYSASHDLQEPIRSVKIYSDLLVRRYGADMEADARRFLDFIHGGATRMEQLVHDLLDYTRITSAAYPRETTDANEAFRNVVLGLAAAISESEAQVTSGPLPAIGMNPTLLQQLLQNLVANALKYRSPDRAPAVHIAAERQEGQWLFSVADNGIGIAPQYSENIFGLFKRLHSSREYSGTGIGLAICKRVVDRYHGRIWVESEAGRGSTFKFTVPDPGEVARAIG